MNVLLVRVARELLAFPVRDVLEVVEAPPVVALPLLPDGVLGQVPHRDRLLPVLSAARLLGVPEGPPAVDGAGAGVLLVLDCDGERAALLADDVLDLAVADASRLRPVPPGGASAVMLGGVLDLGERVAGLVAMDGLRATMLARLTTEAA